MREHFSASFLSTNRHRHRFATVEDDDEDLDDEDEEEDPEPPKPEDVPWSLDLTTLFGKAVILEKELNRQNIVIPAYEMLYNSGLSLPPAESLAMYRIDKNALPGVDMNQYRYAFLSTRIALMEKLQGAKFQLPMGEWSPENEMLLAQVLDFQDKLYVLKIIEAPDMTLRDEADYNAPAGVDLNAHRNKYLLEKLKELQDLEKSQEQEKVDHSTEGGNSPKEKFDKWTDWTEENFRLLREEKDLEKEVKALGIEIDSPLDVGPVNDSAVPGIDINIQRGTFLMNRISELRRVKLNHNPNSWSPKNQRRLAELQDYQTTLLKLSIINASELLNKQKIDWGAVSIADMNKYRSERIDHYWREFRKRENEGGEALEEEEKW